MISLWKKHLRPFFFAPIAATSFGVMRIVWASTALVYSIMEAPDIVRYYSEAGLLPSSLENVVLRPAYRLTIFAFIRDPSWVLEVYAFFIACLVCMLIGKWTRITSTLSILLLFSFHERNSMPAAGGETVLRLTGLILMLSPCISALSVDRIRAQWTNWRLRRQLLPPPTMPIWPWRLVLWQLLIIYGMSVWDKLMGEPWLSGQAVYYVLQSINFVRVPPAIADFFGKASIPLTYGTIVLEVGWLLTLVPRPWWDAIKTGLSGAIRRSFILGSIVFHTGIFALMLVGSFSPAMMTFFAGIAMQEDWQWLKRQLNRWFRGNIAVLYDGNCQLCQRSMFYLQLSDWLGRLKPVNFRVATEKSLVAPDLAMLDLDRAMHVRYTAGSKRGKTLQGFFAFRALAWNIPALWISVPFMYLPGVPWVGKRAYAYIASHRQRCVDGNCAVA